MRLVLDNLSPIGRELVLSNPEMFESEFSDGLHRGLSKSAMVEMMRGTFESAAEMELDYGAPVVKGNSLAAYALFATYGWDTYVNGDLALEDAEALVRDNYRAASGSAKTSRYRSPAKRSATVQPRKANGQFAKKTKAKAASVIPDGYSEEYPGGPLADESGYRLVRCNNCMEIFSEQDMDDPNGDVCPRCGFDGALMDVTKGMFTKSANGKTKNKSTSGKAAGTSKAGPAKKKGVRR